MPYKNVIEGFYRMGPNDGTAQAMWIVRRGENLEVKFWRTGERADQHSPSGTFYTTLRDLCEELGILPGDVPADMGYRGY